MCIRDSTFSVPSGTFQGQVAVSLSTTVSGAQIRYTTDGRLPTAQSALYQGSALQFTRTTQLRAQAFVGQTASGAPGTAMYVARGTTTTTHDLPVILIDSYGAGKPGREYFDAATMIFQPGSGGTTSIASAPTVATRAGLRLRGQSSATFEKTPYRVEFWDNDNDDADYPVLGMPADSDWVLRGPFTDKALIREALSYDLGREMGLQAPRYAFAELYLNTDATPVNANDYMGVYLMVETIKNTKNRLDLEKLHEDDRTLPEIQGGYIWKFECCLCIRDRPCSGPAATCWNYLEVADPSPLQPEQRDWLRNHIQEFHNVLRAPNFADPVTGYPAYIDVGSFVDQLIINELSREMDSYVRSAYFYKDRYTKIFAGPLWDYDLSFGVGGYFQNDQTAGWQYQQTRQPLANDWFTQLLRDPAFVDQVRSRWQTLRRGLLSDAALQSRIDALARPLTNAAQRNFQRWPNLSTALIGFFITPTAPTWQGQVQYLRDWMQRRIAWLDSPAGWGGTTTPPGTGGCSATYTVTNQWSGGFQGEVRVTAGSAAINNWTVSWTFTSGETISQAWNATVTSQGAAVTARNATHNGSVAAGASTTFGFLGTSTAAPGRPALTCTGS